MPDALFVAQPKCQALKVKLNLQMLVTVPHLSHISKNTLPQIAIITLR